MDIQYSTAPLAFVRADAPNFRRITHDGRCRPTAPCPALRYVSALPGMRMAYPFNKGDYHEQQRTRIDNCNPG